MTEHLEGLIRSRLARLLCAVTWVVAGGRASFLSADVVVVSNRTDEPVDFRVLLDGDRTRVEQLAADEQVAIETQGTAELLYDFRGQLARYRLDANAVYYFAQDENEWRVLRKLDLGGNDATFSGRRVREAGRVLRVVEIPVKILVDNHEPATQKVWEPRLRKRVEAASAILERTFSLRLRVVAVEEWRSDDAVTDLREGLREFQEIVDPQPGWLAIGFSGKFRPVPGRVHLGGARGLLHPHILVSEWSAAMSEPERLEVLLHELGHYLGAIHSPDSRSVMRSILADRQAIERKFTIQYDAVNTLIMFLVAEEIRARQTHRISGLSRATRDRLSQIYQSVAEADPKDTSVRQLQTQLRMVPDSALVAGTRRVVAAVQAASPDSRDGPVKGAGPAGPAAGNRLTERYVRAAAEVAATLPPEVGPSAFVLGLGIALDDTGTLRGNFLTGEFCELIETGQQQRGRIQMLGAPTLHGRRDLVRHFFLSAYLAVAFNSDAAEAAGLTKELLDARRSSGFSYVDLSADLAGIHWAEQLVQGAVTLEAVAGHFSVDHCMPPIDGLPEGVHWSQLQVQLQGKGDGSYESFKNQIRARLSRLPRVR